MLLPLVIDGLQQPAAPISENPDRLQPWALALACKQGRPEAVCRKHAVSARAGELRYACVIGPGKPRLNPPEACLKRRRIGCVWPTG